MKCSGGQILEISITTWMSAAGGKASSLFYANNTNQVATILFKIARDQNIVVKWYTNPNSQVVTIKCPKLVNIYHTLGVN